MFTAFENWNSFVFHKSESQLFTENFHYSITSIPLHFRVMRIEMEQDRWKSKASMFEPTLTKIWTKRLFGTLISRPEWFLLYFASLQCQKHLYTKWFLDPETNTKFFISFCNRRNETHVYHRFDGSSAQRTLERTFRGF